MTTYNNSETKIVDLHTENQEQFYNTVEDFLKQIGTNIDEGETKEISEQFTNTFFARLEELHPDTTLRLKEIIENIDGYQNNQELKYFYDFINNICESFNYTEHNINNSFSIETFSNLNGLKQLNTLINGNDQGYKGLAELNRIVQDKQLSGLIPAIKGILNGKTISGDFLVNIANFLNIDTKKDERYNKERRLNNLGKEVFGTGEHSLLTYLETRRSEIWQTYQERFIPATFNDDIILESIFSDQLIAPRLSGQFPGDIQIKIHNVEGSYESLELNPNTKRETPDYDFVELGIFNENGILLEGMKKDQDDIKSGIFDENGNLKEGSLFDQQDNTITIGAFNYDGRFQILQTDTIYNTEIQDYEPVEGYVTAPLSEPVGGESITYCIDDHNLVYFDENQNEYTFTKYTYNASNNTITLDIEDSPITIKKDGENWEKLVFDFLVEHDPMHCFDNQEIQPTNTSPTIFQQLCLNNGINYDNTINTINNGIDIINKNNLEILQNIDIGNLLSLHKGEQKGTFKCGEDGFDQRINTNNKIEEYVRVDNEQMWQECAYHPALIMIWNKRKNYSTFSDDELNTRAPNNLKIGELRFKDKFALFNFIKDNNLLEIYTQKIQAFVDQENPAPNPSRGDRAQEFTTQPGGIESDSDNVDLSEIPNLEENQIQKIFIDKKHILSKKKIADFFNDAKTRTDLNANQKKLLQLAYKGLTEDRKEEDGNTAYDAVKELQGMLNISGKSQDGKFGINTFNELQNAFPKDQPIEENDGNEDEDEIVVDAPVSTSTPQNGGRENINTGQKIVGETYKKIIDTLKDGLGNNTLYFKLLGKEYTFKGNTCKMTDKEKTETFRKTTVNDNHLVYESPSKNKIIIDFSKGSIYLIDKGNKGTGFKINGDRFDGQFNQYDQYFSPQKGKIKYKNTRSYNDPINGTLKCTNYEGKFDGRRETEGIRELSNYSCWITQKTYTSRIEHNEQYKEDFYIYYNNNKDILYTESFTTGENVPIPLDPHLKKWRLQPTPLTPKKEGNNLVLQGHINDLQFTITINSNGDCKKTIQHYGDFGKNPPKSRGKLVYDQFYNKI